MAKQYAEPAAYEAKLDKVMARLGVEEYDYNWDRFSCWVEFRYKGQAYRFAHSVENARQHGIEIRYGSDVFAQVVLSLEDLAQMVERGIYDLATWVAGMKFLPTGADLDPWYTALGFSSKPKTTEEVTKQYRRMAKVMHPDAGGDEEAFLNLRACYERCLEEMNT